MVLCTYIGAMHRHLKNNTPVHTEVLWGGGGYYGQAPHLKHVQQVLDVDDTVAVRVTCTCCRAVIAWFTFAEPDADRQTRHGIMVVSIGFGDFASIDLSIQVRRIGVWKLLK
jgi:hypothetical protein